MKKKVMVIMLTAVMVVLTLATGCSKPSAAPAQPITPKVYRWVTGSDTTTLNNQFSASTTIQDLYAYSHSGLYIGIPSPDGKGVQWVADIADGDPQQVDKDGYVWRINIRKEAKWHNGDPINADTFMYSWKMLIDPKLVNAMSNFLYDRFIKIVNAREYFFQLEDGAPKVAWEDVGIKKVGEYSLELTLTQKSNPEYVKRHFTDRSTFPVYEKIYEAGMNADRTSTTWGASLDQYMGCGAYYYDSWTVGAEHIFVKNPNHWLSNLYKFDRVEVRISADRNARVQMFENGELSVLSLDSVTLDRYRDDPRVKTYTGITPYHLEINSANTEHPIFANPNFRKAIYYAIDRKTIGDILGVLPAAYYINHQAPGYDGMSYRETPEAKAIVPPNYGYDPALAKKYFDQALAEQKVSNVTVEITYVDSESGDKAMSELFEQSWPKIFDGKISVTLRAIPNAVFSPTANWRENPNGMQMNYNDWGASLSRVFPYAAFNYFHSGYASRPNAYITPRFDAAFKACDSEEAKSNPKLMVQRTAELEKIYIEDVINVPLWQEFVYTLYSEDLILPCSVYVPGLGYGSTFGDMKVK